MFANAILLKTILAFMRNRLQKCTFGRGSVRRLQKHKISHKTQPKPLTDAYVNFEQSVPLTIQGEWWLKTIPVHP